MFVLQFVEEDGRGRSKEKLQNTYHKWVTGSWYKALELGSKVFPFQVWEFVFPLVITCKFYPKSHVEYLYLESHSWVLNRFSCSLFGGSCKFTVHSGCYFDPGSRPQPCKFTYTRQEKSDGWISSESAGLEEKQVCEALNCLHLLPGLGD